MKRIPRRTFTAEFKAAAIKLGTEQNRTEQNRTEQNRTEQNRTEQNRNARMHAEVSRKLDIARLTVHGRLATVCRHR